MADAEAEAEVEALLVMLATVAAELPSDGGDA